MSDVGRWLSGRRPEPPMWLEAWLALDGVGDDVGDRLLGAASAALDKARARPGRVRKSAFDLLAADALLTYACEAALEGPDADGTLGAILDRIARR